MLSDMFNQPLMYEQDSAELGEYLVRLVEDVLLLLERHIGRVLVRVAMEPDLVAGVADHGAFFGKALQAVARDEPRGFDVVLVEQLEETARTDGAGEEACREKRKSQLIRRGRRE